MGLGVGPLGVALMLDLPSLIIILLDVFFYFSSILLLISYWLGAMHLGGVAFGLVIDRSKGLLEGIKIFPIFLSCFS